MKIELIHGSNPASVKYLRPFLNRAITFSEEIIESDGDPDLLYIDLVASYLDPDPQKLLVALVDDREKIVAHLVGAIETYYGCVYLTIMHYWRNTGINFDEHLRGDTWKFIQAWGQRWGVNKIRAFARNREVMKAFEKFGLYDTGMAIVESG